MNTLNMVEYVNTLSLIAVNMDSRGECSRVIMNNSDDLKELEEMGIIQYSAVSNVTYKVKMLMDVEFQKVDVKNNINTAREQYQA